MNAAALIKVMSFMFKFFDIKQMMHRNYLHIQAGNGIGKVLLRELLNLYIDFLLIHPPTDGPHKDDKTNSKRQ